ncbi:GntR family transcriptional regulator [Streptomyces lavendulae]|uniref:GntR family transcriptional regulator n=1 Tax=Streptomyces lavendulae TaxID=1914 RepID=UPI003681E1F4
MSTTDRPDALPEETARSLVEAMAEVARIRRGRDAGPGPQAAASSPDRLGQIAAAWIPAAHTRRDAAASSPSDQARWDQLLAKAALDPAPSTRAPRFTADALHALLTALADTSPTATEIADRITAGTRTGRYQPGVALAAPVIAAELQVPVAPVKIAFGDLTASGVLVRAEERTAVPASGHEETVRGRYLALRLQAQMAYGLYPPGSTLPKGTEIGRQYVVADPVVRDALGQLEREGLIQRRPAKPPLVLDAAGRISAPPPCVPASSGTPPVHRFTSAQMERSAAAAYARWQKRLYMPEQYVEREWQLRAMLRQLLQRHSGHRGPRAAAAARAREIESAPLPGTTLLALAHTASVAAAISDLL